MRGKLTEAQSSLPDFEHVQPDSATHRAETGEEGLRPHLSLCLLHRRDWKGRQIWQESGKHLKDKSSGPVPERDVLRDSQVTHPPGLPGRLKCHKTQFKKKARTCIALKMFHL